MKPAALGASIAALTVLTGSLLAPQAASALDFTFSFAGVSGLIENLVDDSQNTCDGTTSSCVVKVTNNGVTGAALGTYTYLAGSGFTVSSGVILGDLGGWAGLSGNSALSFEAGSEGRGRLLDILVGWVARGPVTFAAVKQPQPPASSVPGPLPLLGAAAAFGFSRKLRNRIKATRTTAPTRPAG